MENNRILHHNVIVLPKNYQNWWKFDEVLTKTNLCGFFRHSVCKQRTDTDTVLTAVHRVMIVNRASGENFSLRCLSMHSVFLCLSQQSRPVLQFEMSRCAVAKVGRTGLV